jgi:MarR family 2-MHQ and catechol resistance regulon transcriptional repressor
MPKRSDSQTTLSDAQVAACVRAFAPAFEPRSARAMYALRATATTANERIADWLDAYGLTNRSVNVLMALFCAEGTELPIEAIGREIHTAGARLTVTIDAMERDGLLVRQIDPADRRRIIVKLSVKGRRLIKTAFPVLAGHFQDVFRGLSLRERDLLLDLLARLQSGLTADEQPAKRRSTGPA